LVIEASVKLLLGMLLYTAILWQARRNPRSAGMMLTFPALNGLTLLMTPQAQLSGAVSTMLLMPILNGAICGAFLEFALRRLAAEIAIQRYNYAIFGVMAAAWLLSVTAVLRFDISVRPENHFLFASAVLIVSVFLTVVTRAKPGPKIPPPSRPRISEFAKAHAAKTLLFTLSLALVLAATGMRSAAAYLGVLGALPLIPFFGLFTVSSDSASPIDERRRAVAAMAEGVWLGPIVATGFILGYWHLLQFIAGRLPEPGRTIADVLLLLACWGVCILAIWLSEQALGRHSRRPVEAK
jgi:hypothetical protein